MEELPAILKGVDIFSLLEINVDEDIDLEECKKNLRRLFLKKAKKFHPDKQKKNNNHTELNDFEFIKVKAAYDYLQTNNNFSVLYNKTLSELRAKRKRLERSKHIASKQATYLDSLLKREKEAFEKREEYKKEVYKDYKKDKSKEYENYYDNIFDILHKEHKEVDPSLGQLIIAAKTLDIANGSEINCLLLSSHFPSLFDNYGLIRVEPIDILDTEVDKFIKIGKILFKSKEHAVRALLHYRNNRAKFRCDLYALALGKDELIENKLNNNEAFEKYESYILRRFKSLP